MCDCFYFADSSVMINTRSKLQEKLTDVMIIKIVSGIFLEKCFVTDYETKEQKEHSENFYPHILYLFYITITIIIVIT